MTQSNFSLSNQSGSSFRSALNTALQALATCSSGSTAPSTTYPYQMWQDTSSSPAVLKMRNAANSAWVTVGVWGESSLFSIFTNGSERLRILSDGKVGIGTTTPAYELDVNGEINATGLRVGGVAVGAIADDSITYAKIQNAGANTVLARAAATSGDLGEVALAVSQLIGRGASGDVSAISLGTGLQMSGTTLSLTGGSGGRLIGAPQLFTASGSYNKTTNNPTFIIVEGRGGGGGGGASGQATVGRGGSGGGQGGYFLKYFLASALGTTTAVTVGAGGAGGSGGSGSAGAAGGATSFSTCTANGGGAGARGVETEAVNGGAGGSASGGNVNISGACGALGIAFENRLGTSSAGGGGGGGEGAGVGGVNAAGSAASANTGGGGGGGSSKNTTSNNGGAGGSGWVRIWEYL